MELQQGKRQGHSIAMKRLQEASAVRQTQPLIPTLHMEAPAPFDFFPTICHVPYSFSRSWAEEWTREAFYAGS